ncbi:MAG: MoaD/ThiS family protein [Pseudomonadota bacterium]
MKIVIPSPLRSYTHDVGEVEANGASLAEVLQDLDAHYSGIRFRIMDEQDRIRPHIKIFANQTLIKSIDTALQSTDKVLIVCALSGG